MHGPEHVLVHRLRAIVFINHLILLAGISRTPVALEDWGIAFEARVGLLGANGWERGKWRRYLHGILPIKRLRAALIGEFPALADVLVNPLWKVLRMLEVSSGECGSLLPRLTVDGKPLHGRNRPRLQRRLSSADWQDLVFWLVMLTHDADDAQKYRWARAFVQARLLGCLYLICVQPEFIGAERLVYQLLDHLFHQQCLAAVQGWPVNAEKFEESVRLFRRFPRWLMQRFYLEGELEFNFFFADPQGFEAASWGFALYWDADWHRRVLTSKEQRYLSPTLRLNLKGMPCHRSQRPRTSG